MAEKKPEAWVTFRADKPLIKRLEDRAKKEDRPRSSLIRQLLLRALEANEKTA